MSYIAKNNAYGTLSAGIAAGAESLVLQAGQGDRFPVIASPDYTKITLENASGAREICKVTNRVSGSDVLTVTRAQEGTTALAWNAGDVVELRMTADLVQTAMGHADITTGAHAASAIANTPAGNIAATTVQAAINELDSEKLPLHGKADTAGAADSATTAGTANALNTANAYQVAGLGVGAAKNAGWNAAFPVLDLSGGGACWGSAGGVSLSYNLYHDGTTYRAKGGGTGGSLFWMNTDGSCTWNKTALVAAGAVASQTQLLGLDSSGNLTAAANVSAYSDENVKTNWRDVGEGFIFRLAGVKSGIYDRTDIEATQVGVSAQSLREILPDAVIEDEDGKLSVAYGNAALLSCIELAKHVVALEQRIAALEGK